VRQYTVGYPSDSLASCLRYEAELPTGSIAAVRTTVAIDWRERFRRRYWERSTRTDGVLYSWVVAVAVKFTLVAFQLLLARPLPSPRRHSPSRVRMDKLNHSDCLPEVYGTVRVLLPSSCAECATVTEFTHADAACSCFLECFQFIFVYSQNLLP